MRFLPPLPPAAFPPFFPISRITSEIRSRLITPSYEEISKNRQLLPLTPDNRFEKLVMPLALLA